MKPNKNLLLAAAGIAAFYVWNKNRQVATGAAARAPITPQRPLASSNPVNGILSVLSAFMNKPTTTAGQSAMGASNYGYGIVGGLPAFSIFPDAIISGYTPTWNSDNANALSYGTFGNYGADQGAIGSPSLSAQDQADLMNWYG